MWLVGSGGEFLSCQGERWVPRWVWRWVRRWESPPPSACLPLGLGGRLTMSSRNLVLRWRGCRRIE